MNMLVARFNRALAWTRNVDFVALLGLRLYLLPTLYDGAHAKVTGFSGVVEWFGSPASAGGLNMPLPTLMATLATGTEVAGFLCIAFGLFTRLISVPLMIVMTVAGFTVHWAHGWPAIAGKTAEASLRLDGLMAWLAQEFPGRFNYVTELGDPMILNNGMEFSVTFVLMYMVLFFHGGGRYVSADYWLKKKFRSAWPA